MFVLSKDEEKFVLLPCKPVYTVGRVPCTDLIIQDDLSVSRTHANLHLSGQEDDIINVEDLDSGQEDDILQVEDLDSRYGTFILPRNAREATKIPARTLTPLTEGIRVRFGGSTSLWQVTQLRLVTTGSSLTRAQVQELEQFLKPLGGVVSPSWSEQCSHLTMNEASVTVKLLHALLENKPIVTFAFWRKLLQAARRIHVKEGWPQPEDYQPTNMDVKWRPERTTLFAGKTFVFMNRQHFEIYGAVVLKAGAAWKDLNSGVRKTYLTNKNVIVIQYVPSTQSQATETITSVQGILEQAGLRIIQEYEIGMALLQCSIKEFCNPAHKFSKDSWPTTESMTSSMAFNSSILAPNTERSVGRSSAGIISKLIVPESAEASQQPETSKRAALKRYQFAKILDSSDEEQEKAASKRAKPVLEEKPRRNAKRNAIAIDSPAPLPPSKHIKQRINPLFCLDSSDEENNNEAAKPRESLAPVEAAQVSKKKPVLPAASVTEERDNARLATKAVPPAVARTSPRLKVNSETRNITNKQPEKSGKPPAKANKLPARISEFNFLEKSQPQESSTDSHSLSQSQSQIQPRKRPRLEVLNESDSENHFDFEDSNNEKQKQAEQSNEDSHDGLFNFNKSSEARRQHSEAANQDFRPAWCEMDKAKSKYIVPQRRDLPRKVDVSGWLSCSRLRENDVKPESNVSVEMADKLEKSIKEDPDAEDEKKRIEWLAAMNDGIQVRRCNLNITTTTRNFVHKVDAASALHGSAEKYKGRKNFKKFVKTTNRHPQSRVVALRRL